MPQDISEAAQRSAAEKVAFDIMMRNINLLYLTTRVLAVMDLTYMTRFWVCEHSNRTQASHVQIGAPFIYSSHLRPLHLLRFYCWIGSAFADTV